MWACGRRQTQSDSHTHTQTHTSAWPQYISRGLRLTQNVINFTYVGGRARVETDKRWRTSAARRLNRDEAVKIRRLGGSEWSLYSMLSVVLSQWRERKIGVMWHDLGALTTERARMTIRRSNSYIPGPVVNRYDVHSAPKFSICVRGMECGVRRNKNGHW